MSDSCNSRISRYVKNPSADQTYTEAGTFWAFAGEVGVGPSVVVAGVLLAAVAGALVEAVAGALLAAVLSMVDLIVLVCDDKTIIVDNCLILVCLSFSHIACYQLKKKKGAITRARQERFAVY
jgi:hypothetical protein